MKLKPADLQIESYGVDMGPQRPERIVTRVTYTPTGDHAECSRFKSSELNKNEALKRLSLKLASSK